MSEGADRKPTLKLSTTIDIQSGRHGVLRFRKWVFNDTTAIRKLINDVPRARDFAERLLYRQSIEPALTPEEIKNWDDAELTAVARMWWEEVDRLQKVPLTADSMEALQSSVRQRLAKQTGLLKAIPRDHGFAVSRLSEISSSVIRAGEMARSKLLLDLSGAHSAMEVLRRAELATRPIAAGLQERYSAFSVAQEYLRELQSLTQSRFAGIEAAGRLAGVHSAAIAHSDVEKISRQIRDHFRAYDSTFDSLRIKVALSALDTTAFKRFTPAIAEIESIAATLKGPWVNKLHPEMSAAGVTHIAALTAAVRGATPFATPAVATIREALGDWRELKMPWRLLPDANLRERFYLDHGFDTNLIQLPEPAFSQALVRVGLVCAAESTPADEQPVDNEAVLEQRMSRAFALFRRLERQLRKFIDAQMSARFGTDWELHRCHGNGKIYQTWVAKRDADAGNGLTPQKLIHYIDFREYADLITKTDNWREVFKDIFQREENVREAFARLGPVRVCTMHARVITKTEFTLAAAEITRLLIAIGVPIEEDETD